MKAGTSYGQPIIISYENYPYQTIPTVNDYNTIGGDPIVIRGKNFGHLLNKIQIVSYGMLSVSLPVPSIPCFACLFPSLKSTVTKVS